VQNVILCLHGILTFIDVKFWESELYILLKCYQCWVSYFLKIVLGLHEKVTCYILKVTSYFTSYFIGTFKLQGFKFYFNYNYPLLLYNKLNTTITYMHTCTFI